MVKTLISCIKNENSNFSSGYILNIELIKLIIEYIYIIIYVYIYYRKKEKKYFIDYTLKGSNP